MEQIGREMSRNQSESGIKYLVAAAHTTEKAMPRNPFDEQFSFATRNKITRLVTSNVGSSSPLNTPSISLTENAAFTSLDLTTNTLSTPFTSLIPPDSAFPDFLKTPKIIQEPHKAEPEEGAGKLDAGDSNNNGRESETNSLQGSTSSSLTLSTLSSLSSSLNSTNNALLSSLSANTLRIPAHSHTPLSPAIMAPNNGFDGTKSPKSNAVSVICPPKTAEIESEIVQSLNLSNNNSNNVSNSANNSLNNSNTLNHMNNHAHHNMNNVNLNINPNLTNHDDLKTYLLPKPLNPPLGPLVIGVHTQSDASNSSHSNSSHNSLPAMILNKDPTKGHQNLQNIAHNLQAILPDPSGQESTSIITLTVPAPKRKNKKMSNGQSPGTGHRKEKTVEEMQRKIRDTEKALPPKAKPGRKSKGTVEDEGDQKERKKRSLERNRAAAMRCRLKKKKEVNSLKDRCDIYQQENQRLEQLVMNLQDEVRNLKQKLLSRECQC